MKILGSFQIGGAIRCAALSSLFVFASVGVSLAQEVLVLDDLEFVRPPGEVCTITFGADEGQQIMAWSSSDLKCWVFAGVCNEVAFGEYQFVDFAAVELPGQFYRFERFNPEVPLPSQFEQLRMELGDDGYAEWLQSNLEQSGSLQGLSQEEVGQLPEGSQEQFEESERILDLWLKDHDNESVPLPPVEQLPPAFEDIRQVWGDYDFTKLLVDHIDETGSFQGICDQVIVGWELNDPEIFKLFQKDEAKLAQWVEGFVFELPPSIREEFMGDGFQFPPHLENLRLELGDESFAEWLNRNLEETGNFQGIPENTLPEHGSEAREGFDILEGQIQTWLNDRKENSRR